MRSRQSQSRGTYCCYPSWPWQRWWCHMAWTPGAACRHLSRQLDSWCTGSFPGTWQSFPGEHHQTCMSIASVWWTAYCQMSSHICEVASRSLLYVCKKLQKVIHTSAWTSWISYTIVLLLVFELTCSLQDSAFHPFVALADWVLYVQGCGMKWTTLGSRFS